MEHKLLRAARNGDVKEVRRLVEREKVNPNVQNNRGWTPLHEACFNGQFLVVRYLVEETRVDVRIVNGRGWTALHKACYAEADLSLVQYLVEIAGLSPHAKTNNGSTPLHILCSNLEPSLEIVSYLVEKQEASVDAKNGDGKAPVQCNFSRIPELENREIILYLLHKMVSVDKDILTKVCTGDYAWDVKEMVLAKYASGQGYAEDLANFPIHTLQRLPIPSAIFFGECLDHFPRSALSILDNQGRLPVHVALTSANPTVKSRTVVPMLMGKEPRSILARDPTSGFYPFEAAALLSRHEDQDEGWLDVVYTLLRREPELLRTRVLA